MPAGAVANPPWATGSWSATAWEANTWGAGAPDPPLGSSASGGYVAWMTTVTVTSMLFLAARGAWSLLAAR